MIFSLYCLSSHTHPCTHTHSLPYTALHWNAYCKLGSGSIYNTLVSTSPRLRLITTFFRDRYWDSKHRSSFRYLPGRSKAGKQAKCSQPVLFLFCYSPKGKELQQGLQHGIYRWQRSVQHHWVAYILQEINVCLVLKSLALLFFLGTLLLSIAREDSKIFYWKIKILLCPAAIKPLLTV